MIDIHPTGPTFLFIGVTTGASFSRICFPVWMDAIQAPDVQLIGVDLPLHAPPDDYRRVVARIKSDPLVLGALVTSHKIDIVAAAGDIIDELGPYARLTGEVSSLSKEGRKLVGRATDPTAGGASLASIIGSGYFGRTGGHVLILGAGGAAVALSLHLLRREDPADRPSVVTVVNRSAPRLDSLKTLVSSQDADVTFEFVLNSDPTANDRLVSRLPPGSIMINATGAGKDVPGSPLTDGVIFPRGGVAWDLNYRGDLLFLRQARAQRAARNLIVADGWEYFVHGWTEVISHVLHIDIDPATQARMAQLAAGLRRPDVSGVPARCHGNGR